MPTISLELQQRTLQVRTELGNYGEFVLRFNPNIQNVIANKRADFVQCNSMTYPTLALLGQTYTSEGVVEWLKIQFFELNQFVGVKEKMTDDQLNQVANLFYCDCFYLNIAEIALFFLNYKLGKFGEFYGVVDPLKIMTAKNKFLDERLSALRRQSDKERQEKEAGERDQRALIVDGYNEYLLYKRFKIFQIKKTRKRYEKCIKKTSREKQNTCKD